MTDQETDTLGAVIPYAPEPGNASSEADLVDRAGNAILGLVTGQLARLPQTSKKHETSLRDLRFSFKRVVISFELQTTR